MAKWLATTLFMLGLLLLGGCSTAQRPSPPPQAMEPQDQVPPEATPSEPVIAADDEPIPITSAAPEIETHDGTPTESPDPNDETPAPEPAMNEPNEPTTPEIPAPNAVPPAEVRPQEPDEEPAAAPADPNSTTPQEPDQPPSVALFDGRYAEMLQAYVLENGLVDYSTLNRRRLDLKAVLTDLDELDPNLYERWPKEEKLAFWINTYNLKMLDIITRNYPIESSWWLRLTWPPSDIRHIKGIWTDYKFIVMDEEFTPAEAERRFFRAFDDPRVFLAITYASRSSPSLRQAPYRGEGLDRQLDRQVRQFLAGPQGIQIDRRNMVVRLSALFKPSWRGKEFVRRYGTDKKFKDRDPETRAVLSFLTNYLSDEDVHFLEVENYRIEYLNYDWRLNDTSKGY